MENDYNNNGITKYNVRATVQTEDLAENGGKQCIRIQRYEWTKPSDNPYDGALQQTVEVAPDTKYSFSFLYRLSDHAENGTLVPAFYSVDEIDAEGNVTALLKQKKLYNEQDNKWYSMEKEFTTSSTAKEVRVKVGVKGGYIYSWGGNMRLYADYDNVTLSKIDGLADGIYSLRDAITSERLNATVEGLNVNIDGIDSTSQIIVADVTGKIIEQIKPTCGSVSIELPSSGLYLISNGRNRKTIKVVVR